MRIAVVTITVALAALVCSAASAETSSSAELAAGRRIYVNKCGRCHKFWDPTAYDDKKWNYWMEKMRKKAHLNEEQFEVLSKYLEELRARDKVDGK